MLQVPVTVSAKVGSFEPLKAKVYAEKHSSSSALFVIHHRGIVRSIQECIWVNKHRKFHLIPHFKRKTPSRSSYHYNHSLPSPVCMQDETGFNYTCHFPQEPCLIECKICTCTERLCLLGKFKITISYYLNVNFLSPVSIIFKIMICIISILITVKEFFRHKGSDSSVSYSPITLEFTALWSACIRITSYI